MFVGLLLQRILQLSSSYNHVLLQLKNERGIEAHKQVQGRRALYKGMPRPTFKNKQQVFLVGRNRSPDQQACMKGDKIEYNSVGSMGEKRMGLPAQDEFSGRGRRREVRKSRDKTQGGERADLWLCFGWKLDVILRGSKWEYSSSRSRQTSNSDPAILGYFDPGCFCFLPEMASRSVSPKRRNETMKLIVMTFCGVALGFFIGIFFSRFGLTYGIYTDFLSSQAIHDPSHRPRGTEGLPLGIIVPETDLYQRRLWGKPSEDLPASPSRYLVTFTVGVSQKQTVDNAVSKFPQDCTIVLFHYDGIVDEWNDLEWSKTAIHINVRKQTKWWYVKRFLHPDVVAPYDYIFVWDEDLDLENFNAEKYIELVKKYGLEISQPALASPPDVEPTWRMTKRQDGVEVHKSTVERDGWCTNPNLPPCAGFVEIMAPVFSRKAWRCVWHMIQNDLVHGWGLDHSLQKCAQPAHEKIGVVDAQWIRHLGKPTLGEQGEARDGRQAWEGVHERCHLEWDLFKDRITTAERRDTSRVFPREVL
ncbi:hypothetical protein R1flu_001453 [Riccia fluitans]|uniref:Uncharacterized protein n=1 Tax=Riccia fluitans TaxID=41844 RepID=A0ABD1Y3C2_9MARC